MAAYGEIPMAAVTSESSWEILHPRVDGTLVGCVPRRASIERCQATRRYRAHPALALGVPAMMADVEEIQVVVAHSERATVRVNNVVGNAEAVAGETNDGARAACHAQTLP